MRETGRAKVRSDEGGREGIRKSSRSGKENRESTESL